MSATCPQCGWEGPPTKVANGCCPTCPDDIRVVYESKPLIDVALKTLESFNRRALIALRGASLLDWERGFIDGIKLAVERYGTLGESQQNSLLRIVNRVHAQLHDKAVVDYACIHSPRTTA